MKNITSVLIGLLFCQIVCSQSDSFLFDGKTRTYMVHLPTSYDASLSYPLMLNLHGWGSTAQQQQDYTQMNLVADTAGFVVVYPDAVDNTWNVGFESGVVSSEDDVGFLSALIDTLMEKYSINSCNVFSTGMSRGGFMSYRLACEIPNKIKAIASVTGLMSDSIYNSCNGSTAVPVLQIHGTSDATVNYNGGPGYSSVNSTINLWVNNNACDTSPVETNIPDTDPNDGCTVISYHYLPGNKQKEVLLYKVIDGGHTWPGAFPVATLGNTNQDIKASGEIWNFFRNYLCETTGVSVKPEYPGDQENEIRIFPNPSTGIVKIQYQDKPGQVLIFDMEGKEWYRSEFIPESELQLDMTACKAGLFFVKVITDQNVWIEKLILR